MDKKHITLAHADFSCLAKCQVMLRFPSPVTSGFLGTIGFFLVRTALQISSGVPARSLETFPSA